MDNVNFCYLVIYIYFFPFPYTINFVLTFFIGEITHDLKRIHNACHLVAISLIYTMTAASLFYL